MPQQQEGTNKTYFAMNAGEIACMAGFNSYPHFCTQFKKMMNMAPTAYRGATVYKTT
ncbi:MAG: helix-turn-helix domain-containing protein [Bacteroidales bacterium]|nr:helix-turn-helix domain-containing protein [Bacteroidales bacterium]